MLSRRNVLCSGSLAVTGVLSGCSTLRTPSKPVEVLLQNDDTEEWEMAVTVESDSGEEVFHTENVIPADSGTGLGEVKIEDAFEGTLDEQFTVQVWLDDERAGTFNYKITCPSDNRFNLLVEYQPYASDNEEPVHYVPDRCK